LSSRALSHDSIFLADQPQSSTEPTRVLSQENVHSKIKALQSEYRVRKEEDQAQSLVEPQWRVCMEQMLPLAKLPGRNGPPGTMQTTAMQSQ
uniref:Uncharacterized protein n=1 Tax=Astyanax mexicanus TaxID=7994 RepID=A0A3B1JF85_ASTMX